MGAYKVGRHRFQWTNLHLSREKTDQLRYEFDELGNVARRMGFQQVASGPLVRSSYHAREMAEA